MMIFEYPDAEGESQFASTCNESSLTDRRFIWIEPEFPYFEINSSQAEASSPQIAFAQARYELANSRVERAQAKVELLETKFRPDSSAVKPTSNAIKPRPSGVKSTLPGKKFAPTKVKSSNTSVKFIPLKPTLPSTTVKSLLSSASSLKSTNFPMTVIPKNRDLHFKDDEPVGLVIGEHQERKKLLAAERKADYNKFISEKQNNLHKKGNSTLTRGNSVGSSLHYEQIVQQRREEEEQYRHAHYDESDNNVQLLQKYMEQNENLMKELEYYMSENKHYQELLSARSSISHSSTNAAVESKKINSPHASSYSLPATSPGVLQFRVHGHPSDSTIGQSIFGSIPLHNLSKNKKEQYAKELEKQVQESQTRKAHQARDEGKRESPSFLRHEIIPFSSGCTRATVKDPTDNIINTDKATVDPYGTHYYSLEKIQQETERIKKKNYEAELKLQIIEKNRLDAEQKRKQKLEEEKEAERFHQERFKLQKEYEEEQAKRLHKEEQESLRRERIAELQESRAKEEEERRRIEESAKKKKEKENYIRVESHITDHPPKLPSPPVPSMRIKTSSTNLPKESPTHSVPILSDVAEIRQNIFKQRKEYDSKMKREKETYKVMDRRTLHDDSDDDDNDDELQNVEYSRRRKSLTRALQQDHESL